MGTWSLDQVSGVVTNFDTADLYGNNFNVTFRISYKASTFGSFVEPPKLDWHEKFIMLEHHKRERWVFEKNMYEHNPCSATLLIWPKRYVEAFEMANNRPFAGKGSCKLLDRNNQPVAGAALGNAANPGAKADAVRAYLKSNGGRLEIVIHDIPSLNMPGMTTAAAGGGGGIVLGGGRPVPERKERLLLFNVGVVGMQPKWKGYQHVAVTGGQPKATWTRAGAAGWGVLDLPLPAGYSDVQPPIMVSNPRPPVFAAGECW